MATIRPKATPNRADKSPVATPPRGGRDNVREIIESIAIAFVIAFLFRAFEAEAFVIPTGSMAPTLMGEHKDLFCPKCGFQFQVNASTEHEEVDRCLCPNCRYLLRFGSGLGDDGPIPTTFKGDRIIVAKFPYEMTDPARWDVGVFKYPITPKINFIKRIVGLPRETLQIYHGDIYTAPEGATKFIIVRKPPEKVAAMLQPVYDNDYPAAQLTDSGWPERWHNQSGASWRHSAGDATRYETDGKAAEAWLRYSNFVPTSRDWQAIKDGQPLPRDPANIQPRLVVDLYAYDFPGQTELFWVGDLGLDCELDVRGSSGQVVLELIESNRAYQCHFDIERGTARLSAEGIAEYQPNSLGTAIQGSGRHRVRFANVDDQLLVWVDGRLLEFDATTAYDPGDFRGPSQRDLSPAAIGSRGVALEVAHLRM
jgi:signal peptidase I